MTNPCSDAFRDSRAAAHARGLRTRSANAAKVGPCYRCAAPDAPMLEFGEPGIRVRFCPACAAKVGARPIRSRCDEVAGEREEGRRSPWESAPPSMGTLTPEEFRALAARLVGPERAEVALHPEVDWKRRLYRGRPHGDC